MRSAEIFENGQSIEPKGSRQQPGPKFGDTISPLEKRSGGSRSQ